MYIHLGKSENSLQILYKLPLPSDTHHKHFEVYSSRLFSLHIYTKTYFFFYKNEII